MSDKHFTEDPNDPRLTRGITSTPGPQNEVHVVKPAPERTSAHFIRPFRQTYKHLTCRQTTTMGTALAATYAADPKFYGATYCCECQLYRPVAEFEWLDGLPVGS